MGGLSVDLLGEALEACWAGLVEASYLGVMLGHMVHLAWAVDKASPRGQGDE